MNVAEPIVSVSPAAVQVEELYEQVFPAVARFVSRLGGSFPDAKDVFQDALVIFYEKAAEEKVPETATAEAYIMGIAKHLWARKYKQDITKISFDGMEKEIAIPEDFYATEADHNLLHLLEQSGKKCLDLLKAFYYEKLNLATISELFGYRTVRSATVQKYKCLEKVRETVKEKGVSYEDFV